MAQDQNAIEVYLEVGQKRTFAVVADWPGWCRSGRDEAAALQALCDYAPRYARVLQATALTFRAPSDVSALVVADRLAGNATTDFGAPDASLPGDTEPVEPAVLERWGVILHACWGAFDAAVQAATGQNLRTGPRGGGRDLAKIVEHVREVDAAYLRSLGGTLKLNTDDLAQALEQTRSAILTTLSAAARGEIPARGPRGGLRWTPRYFVRRLAWHELDHAWEIEDRAE
ncbi:MAG: DinB family protein [Anaerolineae bacterium]|nr:DinB family protein [Anaerolineae bacterium]